MQNNCSVRYIQNKISGGFYEKKNFCIRIMSSYMLANCKSKLDTHSRVGAGS